MIIRNTKTRKKKDKRGVYKMRIHINLEGLKDEIFTRLIKRNVNTPNPLTMSEAIEITNLVMKAVIEKIELKE